MAKMDGRSVLIGQQVTSCVLLIDEAYDRIEALEERIDMIDEAYDRIEALEERIDILVNRLDILVELQGKT